MKNSKLILLNVILLTSQTALAKSELTMNEVKVTAKKSSISAPNIQTSKENLKKIAGGTSVVTAEEYKNFRATTLRDVFAFTPGVFAQTRFGEEARLSVRGSGLSRTFHLRGLKLLQDGVPINLADGAADFQEIDPNSYSHIEVFKGANALRYGANTLGGAINFVTPTGYTADKAKINVMTGSFDTRRNAISSGDVIGDVDYFISASNLYSRGYRDHSDQNNSRVFSNIGYRISDNLETRFYYTYANINQEIPGTLTKLQAEQTPKKAASSVLSGDNTRDYFQHRIANKTSYKSENFDLNGGVYTTQKDLYHPIFQVIDQQTSDYGAFSDVNIYSNLSGFKNETTLGANVQTGRTQALQFVNVLGTPRAETNNGLQKSDNLDLYFEDRFSLSDNFTLIAGGQGIYAQRNLGDFFLTDGDRSGETFYRGFSPKFGALYNINENISVFTNYSASYEPPTFSELTQSLPGVSGLADIEAQRSQTFEIGARGTLGKVSFDLSWYYAKLRDELMTYSTGITTTGVLNADDTIHEGIELGLNAMLAENVISNADNISSRLSYAHNNFRFDNDRQWNNNNIPGIPEDFIMFETRYNAPNEQFYIAPNIEYAVEGFAVGYANSLYTDNYMVFGLSAGYKLHKDVEIFADAKNLADKEYVATTGTITTPTSTNQAVFTPADGRSLFVGLTYKFN